ncbi:SDR family oxidoreductase [Flavobacterium sp. ST-87]|uniref:SDR family oxidoreductase n=1 Tax=Flavobacterium plantiphilum TaxID=3163297 RepID=A0ABW8XVZ6_9FLAO
MKKKNVLITGATSGIGYEFAKLYAEKNYNLILVARNEENLRKTAVEMKDIATDKTIQVIEIPIDLFDRESAEKIYQITKKLEIFIDILINNAGQGEWGKFCKTDIEREISLVELNINSVLSLTKFYLRDMILHNKGKILFLASSVSNTPSPYFSVYAATKAFILSFAEAIANEVKDTNITITTLRPGPTDTDFFHKAKAEHTVTYKEKELASPEKVAKAGMKALEKNKLIALPGLQNKFQSILNNIMTEDRITANMEKQLKKSSKKGGRNKPLHPASLREWEYINAIREKQNIVLKQQF